MAVRVLQHAPARHASQATSLPVVVLALALVPAALDLLKLVQPALGPYLALPDVVAGGVAASVLLLMWLRFPRTNWLAAAGVAAVASVALRLSGADVAPLLSLLAIVAVGVGGGYADPEVSPAGV
jgi:hypothetical protein